MAKQMTKSVVKMVAQPSLVMAVTGIAPTVPIERSMYKLEMFDDPNYWESEYAYLGQDSGGDTSATPPAKPWYQSLIDVYGAYQAQNIALKQQDQLARQNAALVAAGKQPLDMSTYMKYSAPQVNVGISSNLQNILIYGGLGLASVFVLMQVMKRR